MLRHLCSVAMALGSEGSLCLLQQHQPGGHGALAGPAAGARAGRRRDGYICISPSALWAPTEALPHTSGVSASDAARHSPLLPSHGEQRVERALGNGGTVGTSLRRCATAQAPQDLPQGDAQARAMGGGGCQVPAMSCFSLFGACSPEPPARGRAAAGGVPCWIGECPQWPTLEPEPEESGCQRSRSSQQDSSVPSPWRALPGWYRFLRYRDVGTAPTQPSDPSDPPSWGTSKWQPHLHPQCGCARGFAPHPMSSRRWGSSRASGAAGFYPNATRCGRGWVLLGHLPSLVSSDRISYRFVKLQQWNRGRNN